ncbi:hypothetical protein EC847_101761 [Scandinavium goeteborgense]|jgi:hypothetical protein|uniref:Uncharacterized protein n=1 Tax=Scandinavium goeteborgense TaxID=1851514 RepID=A0A4R6EYC8_SCAGO|nr:hypothetical protein EC847_101761 [Scandinavium goeteborgense]
MAKLSFTRYYRHNPLLKIRSYTLALAPKSVDMALWP